MPNRPLYTAVLAIGLCSTASIYADSIQNTKKKITNIDKRIHGVRSNIKTKSQQSIQLNKALANVETAIGQTSQTLLNLQKKNRRLTLNIQKKNKDISVLTKKKKQQEGRIAQHIKSQYMMSNVQPLKWIINQNKPEEINRFLTYYRFLILNRNSILNELNQTIQRIKRAQIELKQQQDKLRLSEIKMTAQQTSLNKNRQQQRLILRKLDREIHSNKQKLEEYQNNKKNLQTLLQKLTLESKKFSHKPFSKMRRKLPYPIGLKKPKKTNINQGILFSAKEGESVQAVHPGKVIFSDWLKGYGLLLILDHGQGYLTLYAHNLSLLRKKGESVLKGESIATVGHSGGLRENGLYFEVRYRGKALAAREWFL